MKKLAFAILMCVAAMSAKAQVLTSKTVNNVYETVSNQTEGNFVYNAERNGNDITTMYVYQKAGSKSNVSLTPHMKYEYQYTTDGTLASRVSYRWIDDEWKCMGRHDYNLVFGKYIAEYSRYNNTLGTFDQPIDKMVYSLMPDDSVNYVSNYHRDRPTSDFRLVSEAAIVGLPQLFALTK